MDELKEVLAEVRRISRAERLIVYGLKREGAGERIRGVKVCVVADTRDKDALERELYLGIDGDVALDVLVYTPSEWETLLRDPQSYASRIAEKGREYVEA